VPKCTTYTVTDLTLNQPVPPARCRPPQPYISGQQIAFDGVQFDIKGDAGRGWRHFTVQPSDQAVDVHHVTRSDRCAAGRATARPGQASADNNALNQAHENIDNAQDNVLSVRASVGARHEGTRPTSTVRATT
jgi:flagellar hook-associated protein 3 FlgL